MMNLQILASLLVMEIPSTSRMAQVNPHCLNLEAIREHLCGWDVWVHLLTLSPQIPGGSVGVASPVS